MNIRGIWILSLGVGCAAQTPDEVVLVPDTGLDREINAAPDALIEASDVVQTGETLVLDGSGSRDPDGDPLRFSWELVDLPEGSTVQLEADGAERTRLQADLPGTYEVMLRVSDGEDVGFALWRLRAEAAEDTGGASDTGVPATAP